MEIGFASITWSPSPESWEVNVSNVEFIKGLYEAFGAGDVPTFLRALDPKVEWYEAERHPYRPGGEAFTGPDAVLTDIIMKLVADFDAFAVHPKTFHDAGEVVVVEGRSTATSKKTGQNLDAQICHLWTVKDGMVAKFQQYVDTAHLRDVMGA